MECIDIEPLGPFREHLPRSPYFELSYLSHALSMNPLAAPASYPEHELSCLHPFQCNPGSLEIDIGLLVRAQRRALLYPLRGHPPVFPVDTPVVGACFALRLSPCCVFCSSCFPTRVSDLVVVVSHGVCCRWVPVLALHMFLEILHVFEFLPIAGTGDDTRTWSELPRCPCPLWGRTLLWDWNGCV
jgi:hypothetical protein